MLASALPNRAETPIQRPYDGRHKGSQPNTSLAFSQEFHDNKKGDPIQADSEAVHGMTLKDKLARNIKKFNSNATGGQNIQAYLQDIDFHLEMRPSVTK